MNKSFVALSTAALLCTSASAQGIMGTNKSFSTTEACKNYECTFKRKVKNMWMYETKYSMTYSVSRDNSNPDSRVSEAGILYGLSGNELANPSIVIGAFNTLLGSFEKALFNKSVSKLSLKCFTNIDSEVTDSIKYNGITYYRKCISISMSAGAIVSVSYSAKR